MNEFKTYDANLTTMCSFAGVYPSELKEFLKARYYYLANYLSARRLGRPYDYGPTATNISELVVGKGPTTAQEEYRKFKERELPFRNAQ